MSNFLDRGGSFMKKGSSRQNRKVNFETNSENIKELKECIEWINEIFDTQCMGKVYTSDKKFPHALQYLPFSLHKLRLPR